MILVFFTLFISSSFAQTTISCPTDKTFVSIQPVLNAGKIAEKASAAADRFKYQDHEELTTEKFTVFQKQMKVLFDQFQKKVEKHQAKLAEIKKTLTGKWEVRIEEAQAVDAPQDAFEKSANKNIKLATTKLANFRERFKDQLSTRYESLGRLNDIKASLLAMGKQLAANEEKMDTVSDQYMDVLRSVFDHDGKRTKAPKK